MQDVVLIDCCKEDQTYVTTALKQSQISLLALNQNQATPEFFIEHENRIGLVILGTHHADIDLLEQLQQTESIAKIPVLMIGTNDLALKLKAFSLGADDFIEKSSDPLELRARVQAKLRKRAQELNRELILRGELEINLSLQLARTHTTGESLQLTTKEFQILALLAKNEGHILPRQRIVQQLWGAKVHVLDRTVDSHICGLRRKLGPLSKFIESIPGRGYRFQAKPRSENGETLHRELKNV